MDVCVCVCKTIDFCYLENEILLNIYEITLVILMQKQKTCSSFAKFNYNNQFTIEIESTACISINTLMHDS